MAAAMVAGSDWSTNSAIGRGCWSVAAPHVLDGVAARAVDADDDDVGLELAHAADEILRALQTRQQAIARRRQPGLDDFGAGGIVIDQQDGQRLGHGGRPGCSRGPQLPCHPSKALILTSFPSSQWPGCDLAVGAVDLAVAVALAGAEAAFIALAIADRLDARPVQQHRRGTRRIAPIVGSASVRRTPSPSRRPATKLPSARSTPGFSRTPRPVDWPSRHWPA